MISYDADTWVQKRSPKTDKAMEAYAEQLNHELETLDTESVLDRLIERFGTQTTGELVMSTSFGIHSVVMLHLVYSSLARLKIETRTPVIWIDTGYLPKETYQYSQQLVRLFNLNVHTYQSKYSPAHMEALYGRLWEDESSQAHKLYGELRKVEPMERALGDLKAKVVLAGLRSSQSSHRSTLRMVNIQHGRLKICPLIHWTREQIDAYILQHELPQHPLRAQGYETVGDWHSSRPLTANDTDERSTRFNGRAQECGLHVDIEPTQPQQWSESPPLPQPQEDRLPRVVTIYSKPTCKYCRMAKELFKDKLMADSFQLRELVIGQDVDREVVQARVGNQAVVRTVPQIFIDDTYIGGFEQFTKWVHNS